MNWDVFICYRAEDVDVAESISSIFNENNIKTYFKDNHFDKEEDIANIDYIINNSKAVCLVLSSGCYTSKDFNRKLDVALDANKPIIIFNLDKSPYDNKIKNLLKNRTVIHSSYYTNKTRQQLLNDTKKLLDEYVENLKFHETTEYENIQKMPTSNKETDTTSYGHNNDYNIISPRFKKILILISIISIIILAGIYVSGYMYLPGLSDNYLSIDNKGVSVDKYPVSNKLSLTTTAVNIEDYHCIVYGKIYDNNANLDNYTIQSDYYDSNGSLIDSTRIKIKDIKKENDELLLSDYTSDKIISSVEITIFDQDNKQVYNMFIGDD